MQFRASASSLNATKDYTPHPLLLTLWQFVYQRTGLNSALDQLAATLLRTPEPEVIGRQIATVNPTWKFTIQPPKSSTTLLQTKMP
ncbi:MAG: hypothetical protein EDM05_005920 [Leptolyngbya sp. IPPAS B-1204]|nr:MAG: hypothetical protein EDM05_07010 [Leptolyngbya sp. IPPAS B-1204]